MFKNIKLPSPKSLISVAASVTATAMVIRSLSHDLIPQELRNYFSNKLNYFLTKCTNDMTVIVDEYEGLNKNQLFQASELYLSTIITPSTKKFRASLPEKEKKIHISVGGNEEITDNFCGIFLKWRLVHERSEARYVPYGDEFHSNALTEVKYFVLTFHKKFKNKVVDEYLPYVLEKSKALKDEKKTLKLHTLKNDFMHAGTRMNPWQSVYLDHPAKFETLAMDDEIKSMIVDDLDRFVKRREFYRKVGKAWKRGYLLFGPPGTGKSSLIAAMANYLNFDVYDLELTDLRCNSDLRRLLISTANRSILVVEDIDATIDLSQRKKTAPKPSSQMYPSFVFDQGPKVTLSGLLNFIDGLWSSCGDERIIIFTTNHIEKLDPALLRPGRMDVHIHMSYCTPCGFKMLVSNYLGISNHPLATEAERLISSAKVTPAELGEQLLKGEDPELVLRGLIEFLELKIESDNARGDSVEVTKEEVVMLEAENGESGDRLEEVGDESCSEARKKISKNEEAANALSILFDLVERELGAKNVKDSGISLGSSEVGAVSENGQEEEMESE